MAIEITQEPPITAAERERVRTDHNIQYYIGHEIDLAPNTIYQWAHSYPERLSANNSALRAMRKFIKENPKKAA